MKSRRERQFYEELMRPWRYYKGMRILTPEEVERQRERVDAALLRMELRRRDPWHRFRVWLSDLVRPR